jgi:tungstate transport system ATP-binding protein
MATMSEPIYRIESLIHRYNHEIALAVDALSIAPASITGLMGPNGSGKSTLLKLLAFVEKTSGGEICFNGKPAEPFSPEVRFKVTLLGQEPYLMKRSVFDNIAYGLRLRGEQNGLRERVHQAMALVGLSADTFSRRRWFELSGGEAQRVALAARLVLEPAVLLLDEPTASVDAESAGRIREAALRARERWGTTLVIASHDWQWLYEVCDRVLHFYGGRVFGAGVVSVIRGPWQKGEGHERIRPLSDGRRIVADASAANGENALVAAADLHLSRTVDTATDHRSNVFDGMVSRLILERHSGRILVTVLVDGMGLTTSLDQEEIRALGIYPGGNVIVSFAPEAVQWI